MDTIDNAVPTAVCLPAKASAATAGSDVTAPADVNSLSPGERAGVRGNGPSELPDDAPTLHAPRSTLSFSIPPEDESFFASAIPFKVQVEIRRLLHICQAIHHAPKISKTCRALAAQYQQHGCGYSYSSLRTKYYTYKRTGDWRSLWNKAKAPNTLSRSDAPTLHADFIQFVRKLAENNQRKFAPAHTELLHIWRTHFDLQRKEYKTIPGYRDWPQPADGSDLPAGWSYANLSRKLGDAYTTTAARIGRSAAHGLALKVYSSRVDLRIAEYLQFDDHEFNAKINFAGQRRAMRPKGFLAMDVLSACCVNHVLKPTLWDEIEEKKRVLTERDFMWFVIHTLCTIGYRTDERGTALVIEWGTAAIREWLEARLHDSTRGHVRVERGGKFGAPAHIGQAEGRTHGNFRFKALIESFFNLLDNMLASLPGQVGKDRNHSPEQLHGLERENNKLLEAAERLFNSLSQRERAGVRGTGPSDLQLRYPFLNWPDFAQRFTEILALLNGRTDHKLQGWEKLGFIANEWRLNTNSDWLPEARLLQLPEAERAVARSLIAPLGPIGPSGPLTRARKLSPTEVFEARRDQLHQLPLFKIPEIVGPEHAREISVREGKFEFDDREIDSDPLRFLAVDSRQGRLDGKYQCYVIPFNPAHLVTCDAQNRVVGICPRIIAPSRNDIDGIKKQMGTARAWEANALAELNSRHIDTARENAARRSHNASVMDNSAHPIRNPKSEIRGATPEGAVTEETIHLREQEIAEEPVTEETIRLR